MSDEAIVTNNEGTTVAVTVPSGTAKGFKRIFQYGGREIHSVYHGVGYIKARLQEKSTWIFFTGAIAGASALPRPWSYMSMACGIVAGMIPVSNNNDHSN